MFYKISTRIERDDGFSQECFTHHDSAITKDEQSFMLSFYNNTVQLWKELEIPTTRELELQEKLDKKQRFSNVAWAIMMFVLFGSLVTMFVIANP